MISKEKRVKEYITPARIVKVEGKVKNAEVLLEDFEEQNFFNGIKTCSINGVGYIILDFGKEIYGTIRIKSNRFLNEKSGNNMRIRFGESITETCANIGEKGASNDHSTRDMEIYMSSNSDMEWGNTGFRFVRIDFTLDQTYLISGIIAGFIHRDYEKKGSYNDFGRMKEIYDTACYTVFLNMQNSIWDGIKRDQHLWAGDLYPELLGILYSYGNVPIVKETLNNIMSHYQFPRWYNGIPAYNIWFMLCVNDYIKLTGDQDVALKKSIKDNIKQFEKSVLDKGDFNFDIIEKVQWYPYFFEWSLYDTPYSEMGVYYLLKYALLKISDEDFYDNETKESAKQILEKLNKKKYDITNIKSIESLRILCGENVEESLKVVLNGGAKGCTVFFMYFILKSLADNGKGLDAIKIAKEFYCAMLDKGATTFWENFDIDWVDGSSRIDEFPQKNQKDIHGDYGENCYKGFRHSLCHGWSCGVIPFIIENVIGIKIKNNGFSKIIIEPLLTNTDANCTIPTPYGIMSIGIQKDGKVKIQKPKEIEIVD